MTQFTVNHLPRTIGFDLGSKAGSFTVLGGDGEVIDEGSVSMSPKKIRAFFAEQPQSRVVIEASGSSRWTAKIGMELGHEVIIGNPRKLHHITKSYTKSDGNDAYRLADLGQVRPRLLSPVRLRSDKAHSARMHQRVRAQLVSSRTALINCARGCARSIGHALPSCSTTVFPKRARAALPGSALDVLMPLLEQLEALADQIRACDLKTKQLGEVDFPEAGILRQVSGVGPVLSLAFVCSIDEPTAFKNSRSVGAFFGLAPKSRQSGDDKPQLGISKQGDPETRRLLVSAATYILGPFGQDSDLRRYGQKLGASGSQAARAKARIAVARKLAVLLHRLLITGEEYEPLRNSEHKEQKAS